MNNFKLFLKAILISLFALPPFVHTEDLPPKSPPSFNWQNEKVVPIDMQSVDISYVFDITTQTVKANATVEFKPLETGFPMMDLVPNPTVILFDNTAILSSDFPTIPDPQNATKMRVLKRKVVAQSKHVLYFEYALEEKHMTFTTDSVRSGFFISDLARGGREFFEQFGPANFEFDAVKYRFHVQVTGTTKTHEIFTNGAMNAVGDNKWSIDFAPFYIASSIYFHIADEGHFLKRSFNYQGLEKEYPVTIYSKTQSLVDRASSASRAVLKELEEAYGPIIHDRVVAFITPDGGGMEHCGATMTSLWALEHEFAHFWFARGVMPANGNSGWIDEAVASWRDEGYQTADGEPDRSPVNMSNFSPYKRDTNQLAYTRGEELMREFDYIFEAQGGMKPLLRELYTKHQRQTITYQYFKQFLETATGIDLTAIFNRYVLGKANVGEFDVVGPETFNIRFMNHHHPRPYTMDEIKKYR